MLDCRPLLARARALPCRLKLVADSVLAPLPDILPGALPRLEELELELTELQTALPASWGASPATLPALQYLHVCLRHSAHGRLPPEWSCGFPRLRELLLTDSSTVVSCSRVERLLAATPPLHLPLEWAAPAAFPSLSSLTFFGLHIAELPSVWLEAGGFPTINQM